MEYKCSKCKEFDFKRLEALGNAADWKDCCEVAKAAAESANSECKELRNALAKSLEWKMELDLQRDLNTKLQESRRDLICAIYPFAKIVNESSARIPTERLSFSDWHNLTSLYNKENTPD